MSTFNLSVSTQDFGETVAEFRQVVKTMELATESLHKSADARVEDEPQVIFYESRRAAKEQIEANDIVSDMRTFRDLIY
jgi:hypothetical protein